MWDKIFDTVLKALLGLLVPLAQFLWKKYSEASVENKKRALRQKVAELTSQREVLGNVAGTEEGAAVLLDIDSELKASLAQLARLSGKPSQRGSGDAATAVDASRTTDRSMLARWLLLYTPVGSQAWVAHSLFVLNISIVLLGLIGVLTPWDDESVDGLIGLAIFAIPAFLLNAWANRLDRRNRFGNEGMAVRRTPGPDGGASRA